MKSANAAPFRTLRHNLSLRGINARKGVGMTKVFLFLAVLGASSSLYAALKPTTTTISSSVNPSTYGQPVTFTAAVSSSVGAPPNGDTVEFLQGSNELGTSTLSGGSATFTISTLTTGGTDNIKAKYLGDSTFASSTSAALPQVVDKVPTTTTLASSQNPSNTGLPVTFTATVSATVGTPTGNVIFTSGSKRLGGVSLSGGVASITSSNLATGSDAVIATYNGTTTFSASTSNTVDQVVGNGQFIDSTMVWNNITRYYEVYVPTSLPANPPMLLMLHGTQTQNPPNPQTIISLNWGWQSLASQYGFILVKPASTYNSKSHQWNWDAYTMDEAFQQPPDDSGFLRQLITNLTAQYSVNPNQVYVAGFSSGAQMTQRVAVEISDLVAAVVIGSGTIVGQPSLPPITLPGAPVAPISIQEWHGTEDTEIPPCNNGWTGYSGYKFYLATVDQSFNYWTQQNACTQFANNAPLCSGGSANASTTGNLATSCANNTQVQFIWEEGAGHAFETGQNRTRWQFLSSHPKPTHN